MPDHRTASQRGGPGLIERLRDAIRRRAYSYRTEQAYVDWARRFIVFHGKRSPAELEADDVTVFLAHVARGRPVSAAKRKQALAALGFFLAEVLGKKVPWKRARRTGRPIRFDLEQPRGQYRWRAATRPPVRRYSGARSPRSRRGSSLPWSAA